MNNKLSIVFMGTGLFALHILKSMVQANYNVTAVYTKPNTSYNRRKELQLGVVYAYAVENNIAVFTPSTFKTQDVKDEFINANFDIAIVASYGLILPKAILQSPKFGCINAHGSVLPYWRGASPIQMSILHNKHAGVTLIQMDAGMDTGDIIDTCEYNIVDEDTFSTVLLNLSHIASSMVNNVLYKITNLLEIKKTPQNNDLATKASIIKKEDGLISFAKQTAQYINRHVRAFELFPTTYFYYNNESIKILKTTIVDTTLNINATAGTITDTNNLRIMCANNTVIQVDVLQRQSKKALPYSDFKQGFSFELNKILQ